MNGTNALWKDGTLRQMNLELDSNQSIALFRQNKILRSTRYKTLRKHSSEDTLSIALNAYIFCISQITNFLPSIIEQIRDQLIFLNSLTRLKFSSDNHYFYNTPPKIIANKFPIIIHLCRFFQPGFISYMRIEEKLNHTHLNPERSNTFVMDLIPNDPKHVIKNETSQRSLFKTFCFNNKDTNKTEDFQNLFNKEISSLANPIASNAFISWLNFEERYQNFSPNNWGKINAEYFKKTLHGYIFSVCYKFIPLIL